MSIKSEGISAFYDFTVPIYHNYLASGFWNHNSGKTRTGAEWIRARVESGQARYINLVAETAADCRDTIVEGESGILSISPPGFRPTYTPSKRKLEWPNGAQALLFAADDPEQLRGPQCLIGTTKVLMEDGSQKLIRDIKSGEHVQTRQGPRKVLSAQMTSSKAVVYKLTLTDGRTIIGTSEHLIWIQWKGFVPLIETRVGDCVLSNSMIALVERLPKRQEVYDITVEGAHEFFANGILVHNCDTAWCDEVAKWRYEAALDNLLFGLRLGTDPKCVISTTPRPTEMIKKLVKQKGVAVTRGSTYDNAENLAPSFLSQILSKYENTRLGRQEIEAIILDDNPEALWSQEGIDTYRVSEAPQLFRIAVAVDPGGSSSSTAQVRYQHGHDTKKSETGIVIGGIGEDGHGYVLGDYTLRARPEVWGQRAIEAYYEYNADYIVVETNFGGDMVKYTIHSLDQNVPTKEVHASRGKTIRADPIASLQNEGKIHHVGHFPFLEDQLTSWMPGNTSPDRLDAHVWLMTDLMIGKRRKAVPAVAQRSFRSSARSYKPNESLGPARVYSGRRDAWKDSLILPTRKI